MAGPVNRRTLRHAAQLAWSCSRAEVMFLISATTIASLTVPLVIWLTEVLINRVVSAGHHGAPVSTWLPWAAALGLSFAAQRIFPTFLQNHQRRLAEQIRQHVEAAFLAASTQVQLGLMENPEWHDTMLRASRSAGRQSSLVLGYLQLYGGLVASVSMLGILLSLNPLLVFIAFGLILASAPQQYFQSRIIYELYDKATSNERERMYIRLLLTESFAAKDIQAYRLAPSLLRRHEILARHWLGQFRTAMRRVDYYTAVTGVIIAVLGLAGYVFLISRGMAGTISAGGVAAAIGGFASLGGQFSSISLGAMTIAEDTKFLDDLLDFVPDAPAGATPTAALPESAPPQRHLTTSEGITFDNVSFTYPGASRPVFSGLNLHIRGGELTAIVGGNGSGKSTLAKLLLRFYDPSDGVIRIGGMNLRDLEPEEIRSLIGVLFQDFVVFDFTIRENVTFGRVDAQRPGQAVDDALEAAQAAKFVAAFPHGAETALGHLATSSQHLSGGQLQRLALARLIFRDASLWILDEPTSALDPAAEEAVFNEVRRLLAGRTGVIVSHRFSTVRMADRILVIEAGQIIEQGTHDELMKLDGRYAEFFELQATRYR